MKPLGNAETKAPEAAGRGPNWIVKLAATTITLGVGAILVVSRIDVHSTLWSTSVVAPLIGTLLLAVVVVLIANYLSAGGRSKTGREAIGYDYNARLDL